MKKGLVKRILLALFWPSALIFELAWMMLVAGEAKENRQSTKENQGYGRYEYD